MTRCTVCPLEDDDLPVVRKLVNLPVANAEQAGDILLVEQQSEALAPRLLRGDDAGGSLKGRRAGCSMSDKPLQLADELLRSVVAMRVPLTDLARILCVRPTECIPAVDPTPEV